MLAQEFAGREVDAALGLTESSYAEWFCLVALRPRRQSSFWYGALLREFFGKKQASETRGVGQRLCLFAWSDAFLALNLSSRTFVTSGLHSASIVS